MTHAGIHELDELEQIVAAGGTGLEARTLCDIPCGDRSLPLRTIALGNPDPAVPAIGIFGGVHGLERIGAQVVIAFLQSIVSRLRWDSTLQRQLEGIRLVFVPVVNPGGMWRRTRANPNGVDLMRNAPLEAREKAPFLVGGHRLSPRLPWYRGPVAGPLEAEAAAVCHLVDDELLSHRFSMVVDCHSGFGVTDRIWFPYAHTASPIPHLAEMHALLEILDQTHRHHRYVFEPQSRQYLAHGDLWDYLYLRSLERAERVFLPLTLEMGSWLWVKKNPRQLFSRHGIFNPLIEHRRQRVLRRHLQWLDFMTRAASGHALWLPAGEARETHRRRAMQRWYGGPPP
ncbi:MAG: carboxypeptidase [Rhodocyclaceae bacterium]|nr:MAG: carboxypeptidase [Rhodocyclaceae bacterium]TND01679.1 MAG: carboxypeptidase [Rhodocyclaceae bacterium]